MRTMNRLICVLLCLSCFTVGGCAAKEETIVDTDYYAIIKQEGQYFMSLHEEVSKASVAGSMEIRYPTYAKVSDMKEAILNNAFSQSDRFALSVMSYQNDNKIPICNVDKLYEPVLPDGMKYESVVWRGEHYFFNFRKGDMEGSLDVIDEETFNQRLDDEFTNYFDNELLTLDKTEPDAERGGTVYYYHTKVAALKIHMYTFQQGTKVLYVQEHYFSPYNDTPDYFYAWGYDGVNYYEILVWYVPDPPSPEWYLSFGLIPYIEDTVAP